MKSILKPSWWAQMFLSTFITCLFIYLLKKASDKVNIPVVSDVMEEV